MHIKTAVHTLTQQLHRLGWRTEQAVRLLESWRSRQISREEFVTELDLLAELNREDLSSDELADLELYLEVLDKIKQQTQ